MSQRFGQKTKEGIIFEAQLKQQDIASSINASRETTSRELSALERKGLISINSQLILIKDIEKLRTYL
jgi:CRP-like cAMP-binding protein